jgi:hypothetical protein
MNPLGLGARQQAIPLFVCTRTSAHCFLTPGLVYPESLGDESHSVGVFTEAKASHGANIQYLTKAQTSEPAKQSELASATNTWLPEIFIPRSTTRCLVTSRW